LTQTLISYIQVKVSLPTPNNPLDLDVSLRTPRPLGNFFSNLTLMAEL